ncbi:GIN domain-containing protein [Roseiterribacter gracilis]|uniref:GIN domain-containing protein n=1 Tax=Roseiterribacter gracilis TaxID=2812848 RepID=UPI003B434E8D
MVLVVTVAMSTSLDFGFGDETTTEDRTVASETRTLAEGRGVEIAGPIDTVIRIGSPQSIEIEAPDSLRPQITTELRDGLVHLGFDGKVPRRTKLKARITVPQMEKLHIAGSGNAEIMGLDGGTFAITIDGSGSVDASGTVERTDIMVRGSGDIDLSSLQTRDPTVRVQGSGNVELGDIASGTARVEIRGSGNVTLSGRVDRLETTIAGSGDLDASELEAQDARVEVRGNGDAELHVRRTLEVIRHSGDGVVTNTGSAHVTTTELGKKR